MIEDAGTYERNKDSIGHVHRFHLRRRLGNLRLRMDLVGRNWMVVGKEGGHVYGVLKPLRIYFLVKVSRRSLELWADGFFWGG